MSRAEGTMLAPVKHENVPAHAQWLGGVGAGVWFALDVPNEDEGYRIRRFSPAGDLDCDGLFKQEGSSEFDASQPFEFGYISHCQKVTLSQAGRKFSLIGN